MTAIRLNTLTTATALAAVSLLAGCGNSGPTAAQAGQTLKTDLTKVFHQMNAQDIKVIDDGSKPVPCGKKARYRYAATATKEMLGRDRSGQVGQMVYWLRSTYKIARAEINTVPVEMRNAKAHTNVVLDAPSKTQLSLSGYTDCLRIR